MRMILIGYPLLVLIKRWMERKINEETGLTGIDSRNKILMLSRPIWQQKGGVGFGIFDLFFAFRYGKCSSLLPLQMVRR